MPSPDQATNAAAPRPVITTPRDAVDALGGGRCVASMCKVTESAVSNWCSEGWIPPWWYAALSEALITRGYRVDPQVFRQRQLTTENQARTNG